MTLKKVYELDAITREKRRELWVRAELWNKLAKERDERIKVAYSYDD